MTDETYNGWKNYPTWCVNLWLSNDEGLEQATRECVAAAIEQATFNTFTGKMSTRYEVATALKHFVADDINDGGLMPEQEGFAGDLLGWAMDHVDWYELADAWIEIANEVPA